MDSEKLVKGNLATLEHIGAVRENLRKVIFELYDRAEKHDASKLRTPEAEVLAEHTPELAKVTYGSEEYKDLLAKVQPALDHHYANNRHHPQYHKNGINDMDLIDLVEMLMDWEASTRRMKNGNIRKSIEQNQARFDICPQLSQIFTNTINRYF